MEDVIRRWLPFAAFVFCVYHYCLLLGYRVFFKHRQNIFLIASSAADFAHLRKAIFSSNEMHFFIKVAIC